MGAGSGGGSRDDGDDELVWRDDLSVPRKSENPEADGGDDVGKRGGNDDDFSVLSWNVLSQTSEQANEPYSYRGMELVPPRPWEHRLRQILRTVRSASADVVCLQEVSADTFLSDLLPSLQAKDGGGGYEGVVQKGKGRYPSVATLWKSDKFVLDGTPSHRSRTMTVVLREKNVRDRAAADDRRRLAVVNCHLEGHPHKSYQRVTQMHHALRDASSSDRGAVGPHHGLIACGDFNCPVHSSALSAYLSWGYVPADSGVMEWGRTVPDEVGNVPSHPYNLTSAYPPELTRDRPFEYFTYCRLPGRPGAGLDQIWYTDGPLSRTALRRIFPSEEERTTILEGGLPSAEWPSDHVPIGTVLRWRSRAASGGGDGQKLVDLRVPSPRSRRTEQKSNRTAEEVLADASELLAACPFESDEERREFDYVVSEVPGLPVKGKPSAEQIAALADRRERREKLLAGASDEVRQILSRVLKLRKEAARLK